MKTDDFDRLKAICEQEGLYFDFDPISETAVVAKLKDPWEDVEFVLDTFNGNILRLDSLKLKPSPMVFKPSTEQAYIEQLKKEAFERFGEIKDVDTFDLNFFNRDIITFLCIGPYSLENFRYDKENDNLYYSGFHIYQQGKWAKRIKPFKATYIDWDYIDNMMEVNLIFKIPNWDKAKDKDDIGEYIAEQLTKYLNNETEN